MGVGVHFYNSDEYQPWLAKFNSTTFSSLFSGLDAEGLRGVSKRSLDLDDDFVPRKIRFKTKLNPMEHKVIQEKISKGILEFFYGAVKSNNRWFLVRKRAYPADDVRGWRLVVDISANKHVRPDSFPLPSPPGIAQFLSNFLYTFKADATEAYSQKKVTEETKAYLVLATQSGNVTHTGQPQGLVGSQPCLLRDFAYIYRDVKNLRTYVDNFFGGADDYPTLSTNFFAFLDASVQGNVKLTIGELEYAATSIEAVGFRVSKGSFSPSERLTAAMAQIPSPTDVKSLKSFLASVNVLRNHIPDYNARIATLAPLTRKGASYIWGKDQQAAFHDLRDALLSPEVLKPFDRTLPTRVKPDYNGFENKPGRDPALGASLWQLHGTEWMPCGYGSRFLRESEKNLLKRESAYSSSIGESLAFDFGLNHFYSELSQVDKFEVLCDARNLTYWRTSDSPLLVRLRAKVSGKYDLTRITVRHIPRRLNALSDTLGRLALQPSPTEEDLCLSTYAYNASSLITLHSSNTIPDSFTAQDFSLEELDQLRRAKVSVRGPIFRHLHGRTMFLVPESLRTEDLWQSAHFTESGSHNTLARTRANLSHLHWKAKTRWVSKHWSACERCVPARVSHAAGPVLEYTGQGLRPTFFGQVVSFDTCGPKPSHDGPLHLATCLDGHSGLFNACVISSPNEVNAAKALNHFRCYGVTPTIALFDRAKSYLASASFRGYLKSLGIEPRYSKGHDPRFIMGLERIHHEFNVWHRTLDDPMTWPSHFNEFIFLINSAISESSALSRSGMAFGHGPAHGKLIALRHRTLLNAKADSHELPPARLADGQRVYMLANPKSKDKLALHGVDLIEYTPTTSLIRNNAGDFKHVASNRLRPGPKGPPRVSPGAAEPPLAAPLDILPVRGDSPRANAPAPPLAPAVAPPPISSPILPVANAPARAAPAFAAAPSGPDVNDWLVYKDLHDPYVGVVTSVEAKSVHIHAFAHSAKLNRLTACWTDGSSATVLSDYSRSDWVPNVYLIDRVNLVAWAPRSLSAKFTLPRELQHAIAGFDRDPYEPHT